VRHIFGGWQLSGILRFRTGEPLIVTQSSSKAGSRPDVIDVNNVYVGSCCDITSSVMQYLNPAAFQQGPLRPISRQPVRAGNVGVGQFRAPGFKNLDLSFGKAIAVGGSRRIELRADVLNAFNWINYASVQTNITASDFGKINGTGAARVAQ